jgi:uncharacterized protein YxeA
MVSPDSGAEQKYNIINSGYRMKKLIVIIAAVMALNCASVFAAPPINEHNDRPVVHQNNKKPHHNKVQPKPHHNKKPLKRPYKKMPEKRAPEIRPH